MTDDQIIEARARAMFTRRFPNTPWPESPMDRAWITRQNFIKDAAATLAADKAAGYWLAPMEATPAMSLAFHEGERYGFKTFGQRYCAMRDAALRARQTQDRALLPPSPPSREDK